MKIKTMEPAAMAGAASIQARPLRGKGASILVLADRINPHSDILH